MISYFGFAPFSHYSVVLEYLKPLPPPHVYNFSMEHLDSGTFFMDIDHAVSADKFCQQKEGNVASIMRTTSHIPGFQNAAMAAATFRSIGK